jgi:hypothetical protein
LILDMQKEIGSIILNGAGKYTVQMRHSELVTENASKIYGFWFSSHKLVDKYLEQLCHAEYKSWMRTNEIKRKIYKLTTVTPNTMTNNSDMNPMQITAIAHCGNRRSGSGGIMVA